MRNGAGRSCGLGRISRRCARLMEEGRDEMTPYFLAALRDGSGLVWMSTSGVWLPWSVYKVPGGVNPRRFHNPASAIEVASLFAKRANCGWRVEMKHA